jgi:hypothetical protein
MRQFACEFHGFTSTSTPTDQPEAGGDERAQARPVKSQSSTTIHMGTVATSRAASPRHLQFCQADQSIAAQQQSATMTARCAQPSAGCCHPSMQNQAAQSNRMPAIARRNGSMAMSIADMWNPR